MPSTTSKSGENLTIFFIAIALAGCKERTCETFALRTRDNTLSPPPPSPSLANRSPYLATCLFLLLLWFQLPLLVKEGSRLGQRAAIKDTCHHHRHHDGGSCEMERGV